MPLPQQPITWRGRTVRGIIFDMDGVIADTRDAHAKSWEEFAHRENVPIDIHDFMLKTFGRGNNQVLEYFYPGRPFDAEFFARKGAEKRRSSSTSSAPATCRPCPASPISSTASSPPD
jgi:beta-phosphoglucomutase-like phosphatase (HAD superfamily)